MEINAAIIQFDKILKSRGGTFTDPDLGVVIVLIKARAVRFIARWKKGNVMLTVPAGADVYTFEKAWQTMRGKLIKSRPSESGIIAPGDVVNFGDLNISIHRNESSNRAIVDIKYPEARVILGADDETDDPRVQEMILNGMRVIAKRLAPTLLIMRARLLAGLNNCNPKDFAVSYGYRTLGSCSKDKRIRLSYVLVFYPPEVRDYVICHELAHLKEFDHSSRFHELCNKYCNGREKELIALMREHTARLQKMKLR